MGEVRIYDSMATSDKWLGIKPRQRMLYIYMKALYVDGTNKIVTNGNEPLFIFPWHSANKTCKLYTSRNTFYNDVQALIESGFIESIENNKHLGKPSVYKFSEKWKY